MLGPQAADLTLVRRDWTRIFLISVDVVAGQGLRIVLVRLNSVRVFIIFTARVELKLAVLLTGIVATIDLSVELLEVLLLLCHVLRLVYRRLLRDQSHLVEFRLACHI